MPRTKQSSPFDPSTPPIGMSIPLAPVAEADATDIAIVPLCGALPLAVPFEEAGDPRDPAADVEAQVLARLEVAEVLDQLRRRVPLIERRVIALRFGLGGQHALSLRECATRLGTSVATVRAREVQALARLRGALVEGRAA